MEGTLAARPAARAEAAGTGEAGGPIYDLIELFFFAYRDFVADPDRLLGELGLGRAHHRVLHFVARRPGMPVAELLDILRITKQSLNRSLKELVDKGFVEARTGTADRRQRLLYPTGSGRALALRLARVQTQRILQALGGEREGPARDAAQSFLTAMMDAAPGAEMRSPVRGAKVAP